jgi:hypothetical protein
MAALTKAELDLTTAEWRADLARRGHSVDAVPVVTTKSVNVTRESLLLMTLAEVTHVLDKFEQQISELQGRIATLEAQPSLKYLGTFRDDGRRYSEGSAVTHSGGIWVALKATTERPNHSADWQLAVKSGDHSTPTPRSDASATSNMRMNGVHSRPRIP